jgi:hypothetical protein
MLFQVYAPVDKDKKETYSSNAVEHSYKNMMIDIIMSYGQVLIWQERDDERYMHALRFEKEDLKKIGQCIPCVVHIPVGGGRGKYYIDGPNDGYSVEK